MSSKGIGLVLVCVVLIGSGQLLFKASAAQWRLDAGLWVAVRSLLSTTFLLALVVYGFATLVWIYALRIVPLSAAFPLYALAFLLVPILAHLFAGEPLTANTLIGGAVIIAGVVIAVR
ncbi:MAG TPA: EamA family transporter [Casimicrobiaceae bacterium]|jgi:drug/metabolite transporter (DMT)-like permease|nr:EamA family transporter [Casimicrobiaceae bacterium]